MEALNASWPVHGSGSANPERGRCIKRFFNFRKQDMNVALNNQKQTMTSREIAELTGSDHHNVLATIRKLVREGVISTHETLYIHESNNQSYPQFVVGFRDTMVIVSGYSADLRAKIIDRWQELEAAAPKALDLSDPETLRTALLTYAERVITLTAKVAEQAPAVEFVERYVESDTGSLGFRELCRVLKVKENDFRAFLCDKGIMYKLGRAWTPYAQHIDAGRFEVKTGTANDHAYVQAKFTAKGVAWVAGEFAKYNLQGAI